MYICDLRDQIRDLLEGGFLWTRFPRKRSVKGVNSQKGGRTVPGSCGKLSSRSLRARRKHLKTVRSLQGYLAHKKQHPLGPYRRTMPRAQRWSQGRWAVSYERGDPVLASCHCDQQLVTTKQSKELIPTLGALPSRSNPVQDPVLTRLVSSGMSVGSWAQRAPTCARVCVAQSKCATHSLEPLRCPYRCFSKLRTRTVAGSHGKASPRSI